MSSDFNTIDNLGPSASERYAVGEENYDPSLIKDSNIIPNNTEVSVVLPYVTSEMDEFWGIRKKFRPFASFFRPKGNFSKQLFSHQILPSIGTREAQEKKKDRLMKLNFQNKKKKQTISANVRLQQQFEKDKETLIRFFETVHFLDRLLEDVNGRRSQYHKG